MRSTAILAVRPATNCLTLNDTEGREEKAGVSNRCLMFDDNDENVGILGVPDWGKNTLL